MNIKFCLMYIIVPGAPTDVTVSLLSGSTSVEVAWQRPTDANGILLEYQIIYFGYKGQMPKVTLFHTHTHTHTHRTLRY